MLHKDLKHVTDLAESLGFEVREHNNKLKLYKDDRLVFSIPAGSPRQGGRWMQNVTTELKRRAKVVQSHDSVR